jgi:rhodanese-related sulfurtransferase
LITGCIQTTVQTNPTPTTPLTSITTAASAPTIDAPDAHNLTQQNINNPNFIILDVRTADEFNAGHIAGAINLDYTAAQFTGQEQTIFNILRNRVRGVAATQIMMGLGFNNVPNMAEGITAWIQDGYPATILTTTTPSTTSTRYENGLQLQASVNTTTLTPGETLQINVSEYNTFSTDNNILAATCWGATASASEHARILMCCPLEWQYFRGNTMSRIFRRVHCWNHCSRSLRAVNQTDLALIFQ